MIYIYFRQSTNCPTHSDCRICRRVFGQLPSSVLSERLYDKVATAGNGNRGINYLIETIKFRERS